MQFLKILFWCLLAFVAAVFTFGNWTWVTIRLFGGLLAEVNLPLLLAVTFLIGFLPTLVYQHWARWRLKQRLAAAERQLSDARAALAPPPAPPPPQTPDAAPMGAPDPATGTLL